MRTLLCTLLIGLACAWGTLASAQEPLTARLRITCQPAATLLLNHRPMGMQENWSLTLPPDTPTVLRLSAPGYETQWRTLTLAAGERRHEEFRLEYEPIPVLIRSDTPDTTVLCDGAEIGVTPLAHRFPAPKRYRLVLRSPGHQDLVTALDLSDGKPRVIDGDLRSESGTLVITSTPEGAKLLVNGVEKGVTPCELSRIRAGEHTLTLSLAGHQPITHQVTLSAGERVPLSFPLKPLPTGLTITSTATGARVKINGSYRGNVPLTLKDLLEGNHVIQVSAPGHATETRTVYLKRGATLLEEFALKAVQGSLTVRTQPAAVTILNGKKTIGTTSPEAEGDYTSAPGTFTLGPGKYTLTFRAHGYKDATREVTILPNQEAKLDVRLAFAPDFEVITPEKTFRGVFIRRSPEGYVTLEIKPGSYRTFSPSHFIEARFL